MKSDDDPVQQVVLADTCGRGNGPAVPERAVLAESALTSVEKLIQPAINEVRRELKLAGKKGNFFRRLNLRDVETALVALRSRLPEARRQRALGENRVINEQEGD